MYRRKLHVAAWSLVAGQMILLLAIVALPGPRWWPTPAWLTVIAVLMVATAAAIIVAGAVGLGTGLTASPLPAQAARLRTGGVYACVRHPIYTGLLLGGAGLVLLSGRPTRAVALLALLALLWGKTRLEERMLTARFPGYPAYAASTPRLLPNPVRCLDRRTPG